VGERQITGRSNHRRISRHTSDAELLALFRSIGARWESDGRPWPHYVASYDSEESIRSARKFVASAIASKVVNFERSVGCDFGCWLGFPCVIHLAAGCAEVFGIDIVPEFISIADRWAREHGLDGITFALMETCAAPLPSRSVDWVLVNQVLCNARPATVPDIFAEAYRVLKPGGVLVLADSNNPYCADTKTRLLATFHALELGEGDTDRPRGSNFLHRAAVIRERTKLNVEESEALARRTCYLWGDELSAAAQRQSDNGTLPVSVFRPGDVSVAPVNPENGLPLGSLTDPFAIAGALERLGFRSDITVSPGGGAHSPSAVLDMLKSSQGFFVYGHKS